MPPAAILDVDGTLVDTNYHHAIAWYRALRRHGIVLPLWRIHRHMGMGGDQVVAALADGWTTSADVEATKPHPDLVVAAVEKAGGGPAVMVGDTPWDCESARRAGVETIAVRTGGFSEDELRDAGAVTIFASIAELSEKLDETPLR